MTKIPEKIWLQWCDPDFDEGVTWCRDKINNEDEQYTHTQQLIEWLEGRKKDVVYDTFGHAVMWNSAIDDFIKHLRGTEDESN